MHALDFRRHDDIDLWDPLSPGFHKKIRQNSGRLDYPPRFAILQTIIPMHRMKDSYYTEVHCAMKVNLVLVHCGRTAQSLSLRLPQSQSYW